ncbi:Uncharacterised protein [Chlamydia trachomatis]|nr:Uncharacterised protein [Chlamydia trachomatis]
MHGVWVGFVARHNGARFSGRLNLVIVEATRVVGSSIQGSNHIGAHLSGVVDSFAFLAGHRFGQDITGLINVVDCWGWGNVRCFSSLIHPCLDGFRIDGRGSFCVINAGQSNPCCTVDSFGSVVINTVTDRHRVRSKSGGRVGNLVSLLVRHNRVLRGRRNGDRLRGQSLQRSGHSIIQRLSIDRDTRYPGGHDERTLIID